MPIDYEIRDFSLKLILLIKNSGLIVSLRHTKRVWDKSLTLNIKNEQNQLSDTQSAVLFAFLSNLSILKIYNKEFLKLKSFRSRLF